MAQCLGAAIGVSESSEPVWTVAASNLWINCIRVHQGIGEQTPEQAWSGTGLPAVKNVRARDLQPGILVGRRAFEGDPHLSAVTIEVEWAEAA